MSPTVSRKMQRRMTSATMTAILASLVMWGLGGCGSEDESTPAGAEEPAAGIDAQPSDENREDQAADGEADDREPPPEGKPSGPAESGAGDPRVTELEREARRTVREYVAALDARDGERACGLLAPKALGEIELLQNQGGCASSLEASIGHRDARGIPVWEGASG